MKTLMKILAVVAAVAVILLVAATLLVKFAISPEQVKKHVLPMASEQLHRDLSIEGVDISIWSGIEFRKILLKEPDGSAAFVSADRALLRYQLMPLFSGRLVIDEVVLDHPVINIIRKKDGTFNFSDLAGAGKAKDDSAGKTASPGTADNKNSAPDGLNLLVSTISISDGQLLFTDMAVDGNTPFKYRIENFNLAIDRFSLKESFPVTIEARPGKAMLRITGKAAIKGPAADLRVTLDGLDITDFSPYFVSSAPGTLSGMKAGTDISVNFAKDRVDTSGIITLSDLGFTIKDERTPLLDGEKVSLDYAVKVSIPASQVIISKAGLDLNGILCSITGKAGGDALELDVTLPSQAADRILSALPSSIRAKAGNFTPSGNISAEARLEGPLKDADRLLKKAVLNLEKIRLLSGGNSGVPIEVNGMLALAGKSLKSRNLTVTAGKESRLAIDLQVENIKAKTVNVKTDITSRLVDLDEITGYMRQDNAGEDSGQAQPADTAHGKTAEAREEPGPFDIPVTASGTVNIGLVKFQGMDITDFLLAYILKNNRLHLDQKAGFAKGSLHKVSDINLAVKGLTYTTDIDIKGIEASALMASLASPDMKDVLSGTLDLKGEFHGSGTIPDNVKKNLSGKGEWHISKGRLAGQGLVRELALFLGLKELENLNFDKADGNLLIEKGDLIMKGAFSSDSFMMKPRGRIALSGPVDIYLNARISPELAEKMKGSLKSVISVLKDEDGWYMLPLKISGEYMSPTFTLDEKIIKEKAAGEAARQINRMIFGDDKQQQTGDQKKEHGSGEDVVKDALKNLFK